MYYRRQSSECISTFITSVTRKVWYGSRYFKMSDSLPGYSSTDATFNVTDNKEQVGIKYTKLINLSCTRRWGVRIGCILRKHSKWKPLRRHPQQNPHISPWLLIHSLARVNRESINKWMTERGMGERMDWQTDWCCQVHYLPATR